MCPPSHLDWTLSSHWITIRSSGDCSSMYRPLQTGLFQCPSSISEHNLNINGVCSGSVKPTGSSSPEGVTHVSCCIKVQIHPRSQARDHLESLGHLSRPPERQLERNHDSPPKRGVSARAAALQLGTETPQFLSESHFSNGTAI